MKKFLPSLVCGFAAGVLQAVPVVKSFACCLIIPVAALFTIILDQKANHSNSQITIKKGILLGLLTGIFAALFSSFFDVIITLITKKNDIVLSFGDLQNFLAQFPIDNAVKTQVTSIFSSMVNEIKETGFSMLYTGTILLNSLFTNIIFGIIGGIFGTQYWNARIVKQNREE